MIDLLRELAITLRTLRRHPAFTVAAAATLALGLGVVIALFAVVDHVLWRPLPFAEPERVVTLWETNPGEGVAKGEVASGNFLTWAERSRSFEVLGLAEPHGTDMIVDGRPVALDAWQVSEGFFAALGVQPLHGRTFAPEEYQPGGPPAVLVSESFWRSALGGDPDFPGRTIELDGEAVMVVGVLPATANYPEEYSIWAPKVFSERDLADRRADYRFAVGRLAPGSTVASAQQELDGIAARMEEQYPRTNRGAGVLVVPLEEQIVGPVRRVLWVLLAAAGLLLVAACANVGNLCLARHLRRRREISVRAAVGAGRARLLRQEWMESATLALLGGIAGTLFAYACVSALVAAAPPQLPRVASVALDGRSLAVALGATLLAALAIGGLPALRVLREAPLASLHTGSTPVGSGRDFLAAVQVAFALLLLVGAGLLTRSLLRLLDNDLGFEPTDRSVVQLYLWDRNPTAEDRMQTVAAMRQALAAVPGVERAAVSSSLPFAPEQHDGQSPLEIRGRPTAADEAPWVYLTITSDDYFETMGIARLEGRTFTPEDRLGGAPVALISATLARRFFPQGDAIGSRVTVRAYGPPEEREIVGVVADVRPLSFDSDPRPELYVPFAQSGFGSLCFVVETVPGLAAPLPALERAIWSVDPGQSLAAVARLDDLVAETLASRRLQRGLLAGFAMLALLLTGFGLYGVVSYAVAARTREIGVRMALGAEPVRILGSTLRHGLAMGAWGILGGLLLALATTRLLRHVLYQVSPTDPEVFVRSALGVLVLCAIGSLVPALRAARIDPVIALRQE